MLKTCLEMAQKEVPTLNLFVFFTVITTDNYYVILVLI